MRGVGCTGTCLWQRGCHTDLSPVPAEVRMLGTPSIASVAFDAQVVEFLSGKLCDAPQITSSVQKITLTDVAENQLPCNSDVTYCSISESTESKAQLLSRHNSFQGYVKPQLILFIFSSDSKCRLALNFQMCNVVKNATCFHLACSCAVSTDTMLEMVVTDVIVHWWQMTPFNCLTINWSGHWWVPQLKAHRPLWFRNLERVTTYPNWTLDSKSHSPWKNPALALYLDNKTF